MTRLWFLLLSRVHLSGEKVSGFKLWVHLVAGRSQDWGMGFSGVYMVFRYEKSDSEVFFPVRVRVRQLFSAVKFLKNFFSEMLRIFWKIFWYKNIWLKVGLVQSYGRKCRFRVFSGMSVFSIFGRVGNIWACVTRGGWVRIRWKESFLYWRGLIEEGPNFFWTRFLCPLTSMQILRIFWKKNFFHKNFMCYLPPLVFCRNLRFDFFLESVWAKKSEIFTQSLCYNSVYCVKISDFSDED